LSIYDTTPPHSYFYFYFLNRIKNLSKMPRKDPNNARTDIDKYRRQLGNNV